MGPSIFIIPDKVGNVSTSWPLTLLSDYEPSLPWMSHFHSHQSFPFCATPSVRRQTSVVHLGRVNQKPTNFHSVKSEVIRQTVTTPFTGLLLWFRLKPTDWKVSITTQISRLRMVRDIFDNPLNMFPAHEIHSYLPRSTDPVSQSGTQVFEGGRRPCLFPGNNEKTWPLDIVTSVNYFNP